MVAILPYAPYGYTACGRFYRNCICRLSRASCRPAGQEGVAAADLAGNRQQIQATEHPGRDGDAETLGGAQARGGGSAGNRPRADSPTAPPTRIRTVLLPKGRGWLLTPLRRSL